MIELKNATTGSPTRSILLVGVSFFTLISALPQNAAAADGQPVVWIELGTQLERLADKEEPFTPPFTSALLENPFTPPSVVQAPPRYSFGQEAQIVVNPEGSDWNFSAAVRYGRANKKRSVHQETAPPPVHAIVSVPAFSFYNMGIQLPQANRFATTTAQTDSTHLVVDFKAGKDVGLGILGAHSTSTFDIGVRFAQFTSRSKVRIDTDPDFSMPIKYATTFAGYPAYIKRASNQKWDLYSANLTLARSFSGLGPSLSWDANATLVGKPETGAVTLDWGINGALLFGRQKVKGSHQTNQRYKSVFHSRGPLPTVYSTSHKVSRSRAVIVPDIGGFAGFSLRFSNAKVSMGYRVDKFFGAMDGGIDTRKTFDRDFYGPFATISIGLP